MGVPVPAKPVGSPIPLLKPIFNHRGYYNVLYPWKPHPKLQGFTARFTTWAVAETPMSCVLFCLPFCHLFRKPFAMWRFSFAAPMCLKYTFANFRGKSWKESPVFPGKRVLKHLFPTCHVRVSRFYQSCTPPIASSSSFTSSSSTLNRELQISVGTAWTFGILMRRTQESYLPTTKYLHWIHSLGTLIAGMIGEIGGGIVTRGKFTTATATHGFEIKKRWYSW